MDLNRKLKRENRQLKIDIESYKAKLSLYGEAAQELERERANFKETIEKNKFYKLQIETLQKQFERKMKDNDELDMQLKVSDI